MSEYKAQILTAILVIVVFTVLNTVYPAFFETIWGSIATHVTNVLNIATGS